MYYHWGKKWQKKERPFTGKWLRKVMVWDRGFSKCFNLALVNRRNSCNLTKSIAVRPLWFLNPTAPHHQSNSGSEEMVTASDDLGDFGCFWRETKSTALIKLLLCKKSKALQFLVEMCTRDVQGSFYAHFKLPHSLQLFYISPYCFQVVSLTLSSICPNPNILQNLVQMPPFF